jgi:hypothetical protein
VSEFVDRVREMMEKVEHLKEAILIYTDAVDAAVTQLRKNLETEGKTREQKRSEMPDMTKLTWKNMPAPGNPKGPFELADDANIPEHKKMLELISFAGGTLFSGGYIYWVFDNGVTLGRRKTGKR